MQPFGGWRRLGTRKTLRGCLLLSGTVARDVDEPSEMAPDGMNAEKRSFLALVETSIELYFF